MSLKRKVNVAKPHSQWKAGLPNRPGPQRWTQPLEKEGSLECIPRIDSGVVWNGRAHDLSRSETCPMAATESSGEARLSSNLDRGS